jgi:hypothetical protein
VDNNSITLVVALAHCNDDGAILVNNLVVVQRFQINGVTRSCGFGRYTSRNEHASSRHRRGVVTVVLLIFGSLLIAWWWVRRPRPHNDELRGGDVTGSDVPTSEYGKVTIDAYGQTSLGGDAWPVSQQTYASMSIAAYGETNLKPLDNGNG